MPLSLVNLSRAAAQPGGAGLLFATGCGSEKKPVCVGTPQRFVIVAMTSPSDLGSSRRLAQPVTDQAIEKAVESCGSLTVGIVTDTAANVVLHTKQLQPKRDTAINPKPQRRKMTDEAEDFVRTNYLEPLAHQHAIHGSPFFSVARTVRDDLEAHGIQATAMIMTGDAVFVDEAPSGRAVDSRSGHVDVAALNEFVPHLKGLPPCLMIVGASLGSKIDPNALSATDRQLATTFAKAGVTVKMTPSSDLPSCPDGAA